MCRLSSICRSIWTSPGLVQASYYRGREALDRELLRLTEAQSKGLDEDLQLEEAIERCRAPGPDVLPVEYYQAFTDLLLPCLLKTYLESRRVGFLLRSRWRATP
ncbi:hypothetical protein NDU88_005744 [Pleurodeles waltl]|uniref:Uncharacterized protein n=1 Tax=Pleurodeles waltl TaxID=8319 RepID=A0AAV7W8Q0_PLEWA|nr:hypothetical protein NDU88_005744 [Pleurodeles waltl]